MGKNDFLTPKAVRFSYFMTEQSYITGGLRWMEEGHAQAPPSHETNAHVTQFDMPAGTQHKHIDGSADCKSNQS
jgi:hypothetical protein